MPKAVPAPSQSPLESDDSAQSGISQGIKRKRECCSPGKKLEQFKNEITTMLRTWKNEQDETLSKLVSDIADMKVQFSHVQKTNLEIEKNVQFVSEKYEELINKIEGIERDRINLRDCIRNLEQQVLDIQCGPRSSSIELRNIPEKEKESHEDLKTILVSVGNVLEPGIQPSEIRDVYRLHGKEGRNRTIIAELTSVAKKDAIVSAARNFNKNKNIKDKLHSDHIGLPGPRSPIYVTEYLPPSVKKLLYQAREFAKENGYNFCWHKGGKVFLRKESGKPHCLIKSVKCLTKLQLQQ